MAFNLSQRFPIPQPYNRISDPGAYQKISSAITKINNAPFLSNATRSTDPTNKLWSHAIYNVNISPKILNCTALKSKSPRFPYEASSKQDFEQFLCQCGIENTCECSMSEHEEDEEIVCQGRVRRRLFKGSPPRSNQDNLIKKKASYIQPPFYDAKVTELTAFYKGCKWSQWTSKRSANFGTSGPGPADYTIENKPSYETICAEKVRAYKRKTSKQLRYIEMVQQKNIREKFPGPGAYDPKKLIGTDLKYLGPKAERFSTSLYDVRPGPSDHFVKRDFDPKEIPEKFCRARLIDPAPFGVRDKRLKHKCVDGPSPASYDVKDKTCNIMQCSKAPFGTSAKRFKDLLESNEEDNESDDESRQNENEHITNDTCLLPTWEFRSQTVRLKPLFKRWNEPSPADLPQHNVKISRSIRLQNTAPFFTSNERFRPWYNWISIHGAVNTPGPGYYSLEKQKCLPAVHRGPLFRSSRFKLVVSQSPSPNQYKVGGGIESVLATHNERLKGIMERQHKFRWQPANETRKLSFEETEQMLINKSIDLLQPCA